MREIELTQDKVALVDDEDYDRVSEINWVYQAKENGRPGYATHSQIFGSKRKKKAFGYA